MPRKKGIPEEIEVVNSEAPTPEEMDAPKTDLFDLDAPTPEELEQAAKKAAESSPEDEVDQDVPMTIKEMMRMHEDYMRQRESRQETNLISGSYAAAKRNFRILESTIASVESDKDSTYWVCYEGPVTIRIPYDKAYDDLSATSLNRERDRVNFLTPSIGATVPFVITDLKELEGGKMIVTASRVLALRRIRARYFGKRAVKPVQVGDIVNAQIIACGRYALRVNINGIDCRITNNELTHRYISLVNEQYAPGEMVRVKIMNIDEEAGKIPVVTASGKEAERDQLPELQYRVKAGMRTNATVISIQRQHDPEPRLHVSLFADGINYPGYAYLIQSNEDDIHSGDIVLYEIEGITKGNYAFGRIVRIIKKV